MSNPESPNVVVAGDIVAIRAALGRVPEAASEERGDSRVVRTSHATEAELEAIEEAIDHPPLKADHFGTAVSLLGAAAIVAKTIASPIDRLGPKDMSMIIVAALLGGAQLFRYGRALFAPTPLKDVAKRHIRRLKMAQGWRSEDEPVSNWRKLRALLWEKIFSWLK